MDGTNRSRRTRGGTYPRLFVAALLVALAALLSTMGATAAYAYPVEHGTLERIAGTLLPGNLVTIEGEGFAPGATVSVDVSSNPIHLADVTADGAGTFITQVRIPSSLSAGEHELTATGVTADGSTLVLTLAFTVSGGLPVTGNNTAAVAATGGLVLFVGGGLVLASVFGRRRREAAADADA